MKIMIKSPVLFILLFTFSTSCNDRINSNIAAPCTYFLLDKDSIQVEKYTKGYENKLSSDIVNMQDSLTQIMYHTFDYDGGTDSEYTFIFLSDGSKHIMYKLDHKHEIKFKKPINDANDEKAKKIIEHLLAEKDKYIGRECLISGGAASFLLIQKGKSNSLEYFYESEGYECDVLGEHNEQENASKLIRLLKSFE